MSKQRHSIIPAVYLILLRDNKVLVLRRHNTGFADGRLTFPAGHVDQGETFLMAACREAKEELGLNIALRQIRPMRLMHRFAVDGSERIDMFVLVEQFDDEPINAEPHKSSEVLWIPVNALPDDLLDYAKAGFTAGMAGQFYSELWKQGV